MRRLDPAQRRDMILGMTLQQKHQLEAFISADRKGKQQGISTLSNTQRCTERDQISESSGDEEESAEAQADLLSDSADSNNDCGGCLENHAGDLDGLGRDMPALLLCNAGNVGERRIGELKGTELR